MQKYIQTHVYVQMCGCFSLQGDPKNAHPAPCRRSQSPHHRCRHRAFGSKMDKLTWKSGEKPMELLWDRTIGFQNSGLGRTIGGLSNTKPSTIVRL